MNDDLVGFDKEDKLCVPGILKPGTLRQSIEQLSSSKHTPTDLDYLHLVVRYMVGYIKQDVDSIIYESDADLILAQLLYPNFKNNYNKLIELCEYPLRMLADIGSTIEIVRDIIERPLDVETSYTGIDLGTGTGITLLAQYIQAKRNVYSNGKIKNVGIEKNKQVGNITKKFINGLGVGDVVLGDTTDENIYNGISNIDFITNENIPYYGSSFYGKVIIDGISRTHGEPFFVNLHNLYKNDFDIHSIKKFPSDLVCGIIGVGRSSIDNSTYRYLKGQFFLQDNLNSLKEINDVNQLQFQTTPTHIELSGVIKDITTVGKNYYDGDNKLLNKNKLSFGRWN